MRHMYVSLHWESLLKLHSYKMFLKNDISLIMNIYQVSLRSVFVSRSVCAGERMGTVLQASPWVWKRVRGVYIKVQELVSTLHLSKWVRIGTTHWSSTESNDSTDSWKIKIGYFLNYFCFQKYSNYQQRTLSLNVTNESSYRDQLSKIQSPFKSFNIHSVITINSQWCLVGNLHALLALWLRVSMRSGLASRCLGGNGNADSLPGQREWMSRKGERSVLMEVWGPVSFQHLS